MSLYFRETNRSDILATILMSTKFTPGHPPQYLGPYVEEAIPHEAGHILLGKALGLPPRGLEVNIVRLPDGSLQVGDFATLAWEVPEAEIPTLDSEVKESICFFISGGVAGQMFARVQVGSGADDDRRQLARISERPIEFYAKISQPMFNKRKLIFWQLVALIRQRYSEVVLKNQIIQTGRHSLLTDEDVHKIFVANSPILSAAQPGETEV